MLHPFCLALTARLALLPAACGQLEAPDRPASGQPAAPAIAHAGFADVHEPLLYYEELGSGPPVVLIHGGLLGRRMCLAE